MATPKGLVPVTQADLELAYEFTRTGYMAGSDGIQLLAEIAARHRADALTEALRVMREARESLLIAKDYADDMAVGGLVNPEGLQQFIELGKEDQKRIGAVLATLTAFLAQHEGEEA